MILKILGLCGGQYQGTGGRHGGVTLSSRMAIAINQMIFAMLILSTLLE